MNRNKDDETTHRLPETNEGQISTYVEAFNFLLIFWATNLNIDKATSDIVCIKKTSIKTLVKFADVL